MTEHSYRSGVCDLAVDGVPAAAAATAATATTNCCCCWFPPGTFFFFFFLRKTSVVDTWVPEQMGNSPIIRQGQ